METSIAEEPANSIVCRCFELRVFQGAAASSAVIYGLALQQETPVRGPVPRRHRGKHRGRGGSRRVPSRNRSGFGGRCPGHGAAPWGERAGVPCCSAPLFPAKQQRFGRCRSEMNVLAAWQRGYTGKNVVVTILDDGIERNHPDLLQNYDPLASYDVNGNDHDPTPRYDASNENKHGTRCAGEVAAAANNSYCVVGIAYNARIRMLDGDVTDVVEAKSLGIRPDYIDIYSASWGPDDDGKTVDGPGLLAKQAFEHGIKKGRRGLGSIFVWASGNGGREGDYCSCDGYTNSIYTISVSSTTENGYKPWYLEECASTLATTYSSGAFYERKIVSSPAVTTDLRHRCTDGHTGTSVSAPMVAGIIALALEANPLLTWRDVQHLLVKTSRPVHLRAADWKTNGSSLFSVSHLYGFGLVDAEAIVMEAKKWKSVPPQHVCVGSLDRVPKYIRADHVVRATTLTSACADHYDQHVVYLEHVVVRVSISHPRRGDLQISLVSPAGTRSHDPSPAPKGFKGWEFMTVHCWGEKAAGEWTLEIHDTPSQVRNPAAQGKGQAQPRSAFAGRSGPPEISLCVAITLRWLLWLWCSAKCYCPDFQKQLYQTEPRNPDQTACSGGAGGRAKRGAWNGFSPDSKFAANRSKVSKIKV
uniref:P/Homo B domain-containing protein n=1 Tax=Apteryx owenii TaxID=8824 RepID=A0A8B9NU07_APTOW